MKLYHYWRSSCSWRVRWGLALKNIPCEMIAINLLNGESESPEHLTRNPMGYVPVLEVPDRTGPRFLAESIAILEWLDETQPAPALLPRDLFARAHVRQLVETINAGTQPMQNLTVFQAHSSDPAVQKEWNQMWTRKGLLAFQTLCEKSAGTYSFGNTVTLADLFLIPQVYNAKRFELDLGEFPLLHRIYLKALETEACQASLPERYEPKA